MSSGAGLRVLISIGLYPIVTRIFTKEQFGGLGLYLAVVGIIALAGTSLYPSGLVIPKFKRDFYALVKLSISLAIIVVIVTSFTIFFFKDTFIYIFKLETLGNLIYLIPFGIALTCITDISLNWNVRNKDFKKNAFSGVASGGSLKIMNISHGLVFGPTLIGLIISNWISVIIAISTLGVKKMIIGLRVLRRVSLKETIVIGKTYKKYPLNLLPGNLLNKYTTDLPIYMLTAYFSPAITGAFVLADNIMKIPLNVIGNSLGLVFLQRANELYLTSPKSMSDFAYETNKKMLKVGVLSFGFLFGFGDLIFAIVFGKKWAIAGTFARILSTYFIFKLISGPMAKVFRVVGKEQYSLYVSCVLAVVRFVGIYLGVISNDYMLAITYFTIANIIGYLVTYVFLFKACNLPILQSFVETITIVIVSYGLFFLLRKGFDNIIDTSIFLKSSIE